MLVALAVALAAQGQPETVRAVHSRTGAIVYVVSPSRADTSRPLREMAQESGASAPQEEGEPPENPPLPAWRWIRSAAPDPVAQPVPRDGGGPRPLAPPAQFNFDGIPMAVFEPSDSNGSVGNDQFVETVNVQLEVWSLNRTLRRATPVLGPVGIRTLWIGFGGPCEAQNSGDPVVLFDKLANRWLVSQLTITPVSGVLYECVAVSATADATGSYHRYAFAVPGGALGDYPHYGVWTDAYYAMAHAYTPVGGDYRFRSAMFAALDRTKMLQGDPTATWQVIEDPLEGGHMPADLDGFAPPPTAAPGVFLSLHPGALHVYRMKVDFAVPVNTSRTLQAIVPIASFTAACPDGDACISQPGSSIKLSSIGDRLMFRAAYRNFGDHETVVVSHSVDPGILGVAAGVRWYDLRLSGTPDPSCPSYPCLHQQGTIADYELGRSRWMPSLAMDGAENLLVGYSVSGTTNGVDNHSLRTTGRARNDPLGTMTVPEATLVTGTANNTIERWGDYASMSADPHDDCTLWSVGQYYGLEDRWATRIASAAFPAGTGDGQCAPTSCTVRPVAAPVMGAASLPGDNQIRVTWTGVVPSAGSYAVERAEGPCGGEGLYRPLGVVAGGETSFLDTAVDGGWTYAYRVRAASDGGGRCQALTGSACVQVTATGSCRRAPAFAGAAAATSADAATCGIEVSWSPGASGCPLTPNLHYNVYRGTVPDFVPSAANRIATCLPGPADALDDDALASGVTHYYVVRAEDDSTGNGGPCGGGNEDGNGVVVAGTAYGVGLQAGPGTWSDGGGDGTALLQPGPSTEPVWRLVGGDVDASANHTPDGSYAYRTAGPSAQATYGSNQCAAIETPSLVVGGGGARLTYWERHQIEVRWDGVVVEASQNDGPWEVVPPPSNDPGVGCDAADSVEDWVPLSCTGSPPHNACGDGNSTLVISGPLASGTTCATYHPGPMGVYAHRCHPIPWLGEGDSVRFRWRLTSDSGSELAGLYLDDVAVSGIRLPNACTPNPCGGSSQSPPPEITGLHVAHGAGTTLSWTSSPAAVAYDVAGIGLADLRMGGLALATCLADGAPGATFSDPDPDPAPGEGRLYLVRAQGACGPGTYGFDSASVERVLPAACP